MKYLFLTLFLSIIVSCESVSKKETDNLKEETENSQQAENVKEELSYVSFGEAINTDKVLSQRDLSEIYLGLQVGDTVDVKFSSTINTVCKKKGCWMKLQVSEDQETMVRFKDYGFFVPKNSQGREVIVEGMAFLDETSVEDLRHYAEDEGKTKEEIEAIQEPKVNYAFTATGVLVQGVEKDFEGEVEPIASSNENQVEEEVAE